MKKTGKMRILRGQCPGYSFTPNGEGHLVMEGVRKGIGYRVVKFCWIANNIVSDSQGGNADGVGYLSLTPCTDPNLQGKPTLGIAQSNPGFLADYQIAWTFNHVPSYKTMNAPWECIDPDHMVVDYLYLNINPVYSTAGLKNSYVIHLEEYELNSSEMVLYQIANQQQNVTNP